MPAVGSMAIVSALVVGTLFGMASMVPRSRSMPGSLCRAMSISGGVGIVAGRAAVITMPGRVVGVGVCGVRVTSPSVGIRTVVIGMVAVTGRVLITSEGGCSKYKGREN
jgi:hypothetical protein